MTDLKTYLAEQEIARHPNPAVRQRYADLVAAGNEPQFALMLATQSPPRTRQSDRTFNEECRRNMSAEKFTSKKYLEMAKKSGISTQGKFYVGGLGRPTDPQAWVSTVDEAKDTCRRKNLSATGMFEHKGTPMPPPAKKKLAPDIEASYIRSALAKDGALREKCRKNPRKLRELAEAAASRHAKQ